ncbi:hypothetical protein XvhCFBP2543_19725 [Xanthomonas vasicola]|uniref:hypothetical protein n=1 Tax=Xanthomonas vasicola TaxID=56459 RepID=UPI0005321861|nr:hypothetical protein [Xanthomonas vasicola]KGR38321.1 hypothetical protein NX04_20800 [Xanthomonas vasicola]KGR45283.1 hypothetical protein NX05_07325 [Xanthomonas vasicola]KGR58418.1 hypothetical protein NX79_19120 [Xanthomonas vasicola]MDO6986497.1 hypothetical protein [Xanthomonas vasicola]PPV00980.1 hypothetical protein XvhCFBP2543_19725 [Xanthomonas vasicola]
MADSLTAARALGRLPGSLLAAVLSPESHKERVMQGVSQACYGGATNADLDAVFQGCHVHDHNPFA